MCQYCRGAPLQVKEHQWEYIYPVVCFNTAEELFYKTRSTSGCRITLFCVLILQRSSSTRSTSGSLPTLLCVLIQQRSSSTRQGAPVGVYLPCCVCRYCRGALLLGREHQWEYIYPVVYVNTAEDLFYKTRSTSRSISTLLCVSTAEELFYMARSTSGCISTLLCVLILQRSSSTRSTSGSIPTLLCV